MYVAKSSLRVKSVQHGVQQSPAALERERSREHGRLGDCGAVIGKESCRGKSASCSSCAENELRRSGVRQPCRATAPAIPELLTFTDRHSKLKVTRLEFSRDRPKIRLAPRLLSPAGAIFI